MEPSDEPVPLTEAELAEDERRLERAKRAAVVWRSVFGPNSIPAEWDELPTVMQTAFRLVADELDDGKVDGPIVIG